MSFEREGILIRRSLFGLELLVDGVSMGDDFPSYRSALDWFLNNSGAETPQDVYTLEEIFGGPSMQEVFERDTGHGPTKPGRWYAVSDEVEGVVALTAYEVRGELWWFWHDQAEPENLWTHGWPCAAPLGGA